ncbi:MAG: hypothetical protein JWO35_331 [Candidatus Saccharibacteria bacterium]|nr:hypothetical protein [Candidatus Saccharibacteria bacterium]
MKLMITIGIFVGGSLGAWLGSSFDHGNLFGVWGILLSTVGSFVGLWAGYKAGQNLGF